MASCRSFSFLRILFQDNLIHGIIFKCLSICWLFLICTSVPDMTSGLQALYPTAYLKLRAFQILPRLVSNIPLSSLPPSRWRALSLCRDFHSCFLFQEGCSLLYLHGYFLLILRQNFPNYTKFLPPPCTGILSLGSLLSIFIELFKLEIIY